MFIRASTTEVEFYSEDGSRASWNLKLMGLCSVPTLRAWRGGTDTLATSQNTVHKGEVLKSGSDGTLFLLINSGSD